MLCKLPRQIVIIEPWRDISVSVSGSGNATYCYATIKGTKVTAAGTHTIGKNDSKVITFGVYGYSATYYGEVTINGAQVLKVTDRTTHTYEYTVPAGVTSVTIAMTYTSTTNRRNGKITVTTS